MFIKIMFSIILTVWVALPLVLLSLKFDEEDTQNGAPNSKVKRPKGS